MRVTGVALHATIRKSGGDDEGESDSQRVALPSTVPSFVPPKSVPPSDPPYETRKPARRLLNPEYEEDE